MHSRSHRLLSPEAPHGRRRRLGTFRTNPGHARGGDLGRITRRDVVLELRRAIDRFARTGVVPALVEARCGLHIVRVRRFEPGPPLRFEAVRARIEERLAQRSLIGALRGYTHSLLQSERGRGTLH